MKSTINTIQFSHTPNDDCVGMLEVASFPGPPHTQTYCK